MFFIFFPPHIF